MAVKPDSAPAEDDVVVPSPPAGLPDGAEFMGERVNGTLWFVPAKGQHGAVYNVTPSGEVRFAESCDYDLPPLPKTSPKKTHQPKGGRMATKEATPKTKSKLAVAKEGTDAELAAFLLAHPTYADSVWKDRAGRKTRKDDESRSDFIVRVLGEPAENGEEG
jgi:hypothetical protein